jgi:hypothetical protein
VTGERGNSGERLAVGYGGAPFWLGSVIAAVGAIVLGVQIARGLAPVLAVLASVGLAACLALLVWLITRLAGAPALVLDREGITCRTPPFRAAWSDVESAELRSSSGGYGTNWQLIVHFHDPELLRRQRTGRVRNPLLTWGGRAWIPLSMLDAKPAVLAERFRALAGLDLGGDVVDG